MINKVRLVVGEDSFKIIDAKTEEWIASIGRDEDSFFSVKHLLEGLGIETLIEEKERVIKLPTHNNFIQMLKDMYEFTKQSKNSKILPADDMKFCLIGYIAYYEVLREDGRVAREVSKEFTIKPSDAVKTTVDIKFPKCSIIDPNRIVEGWGVGEARKRLEYCDKDFLQHLFEG
jgi:hypothetical protein